MQALIGARIGDYDIEAEIGRGAMGVVYRARQVSLNRPVALKVLPAHLAQDEAYIARFKREAQAAAALSHSNIVHVYTANTTDDLHYFVMEYVEGETLHDRLAREGRIPPDEAVAICVYLAQALDYAWKKAQIIHRDIKPSNIFLSNDGEVKLGDLGLAKSVGDMSAGQSVTKDGQTVGTAYFMSPEQARGDHDLDFRSDIYSLGCTLYQMISGRFPYEGTFGTVIAKQITEPPPAVLKVAPDCPMPVVKLLSKMLAKHPTARHQSYEELIQNLWRAHDQITNPERRGRREEAIVPEAEPAQPPHAGSYIKKPAVLYAAMTTATSIALAGVLVWAPWKQSEQQPLNSEDGKARSAPVTQTLLSAAVESPKEEPKAASEAPPPGSESRLQAEAVSHSQPPAKAGTPNAVVTSITQPTENVGGASAPRLSAAEGQTLAHSATKQSRGAEAAPTLQKPVAERASVQQSAPSPADGTLARPATNTTVIQVAQATLQPASPSTTPAAQPTTPQPADEAFVKSVGAMQPEQQVQAVIAKLKELNPNFDGKETHKIENGAVTMLGFSTVGVTDISPVKALRWLRTLTITPPALNQKGSLENLAPLQGMQLTWLWCHNNPITDLSPLKGMPLTVLSFGGTQVSDLSPLAGMKLQVLSFNDTVVSDIAALEGMPLTVLWCNNTKVSDLSPVKAVTLREIKCDFVAERDAAVLRGIRTLAKINDLPAATFWMRVGPVAQTAAVGRSPLAGAPTTTTTPPKLATPASAPSGLSAKKQIEQFVVKMKELNSEFDGSAVKWKAEGSRIVEIEFPTEHVSDVRPVAGFAALRMLRLAGPTGGNRSAISDLTPLRSLPLEILYFDGSTVSDLSPLKGMRLKELWCNRTRVEDLSDLRGMPLLRLCCFTSRVTDFSPLKGMKLATLNAEGTRVSDLSPLQGMPLVYLNVGNRTRVTDLSPIRGMKLESVMFYDTEVSDPSVLKGMPIRTLWCHKTRLDTLSFVKGMPLLELKCDFVPERDTKLLRSIKTLEQINDLPAKEFWKRVEAGEVPQAK